MSVAKSTPAEASSGERSTSIDASPPTTRDVETGIDEEATEPGVEAIRIAQRRAGSARLG